MLSVLVASVVGSAVAKWAAVEGISATTLVGVGAADGLAVGGAAQNGIGAFMERYDGTKWAKEKIDGAGLMLDAAVDSQYTVGTTMLPILVSRDGGATYVTSDSLGAISQSTHVVDGVISVVGTLVRPRGDGPPSGTYGVGRSADGGETWKVSETNAGDARYGAFPSDNVWYVSNGMWGSDAVEAAAYAKRAATAGHHQLHDAAAQAANSFARFPLSARAVLGGIHEGGVYFHERPAPGAGNRGYRNGSSIPGEEPTGWYGSISKTTDGGATWTTVFQSDLMKDTYYFNGIACASELLCVAVAEGDNLATGGYLNKAIVTADGGATWTDVLTADNTPTNMVSLMGAAWETETEGWIVGTTKQGPKLSAAFFKTTDGGKSYRLEQMLDDCLALDLDFSDGVGVAACSSSSGASSYLAMYNA